MDLQTQFHQFVYDAHVFWIGLVVYSGYFCTNKCLCLEVSELISAVLLININWPFRIKKEKWCGTNGTWQINELSVFSFIMYSVVWDLTKASGDQSNLLRTKALLWLFQPLLRHLHWLCFCSRVCLWVREIWEHTVQTVHIYVSCLLFKVVLHSPWTCVFYKALIICLSGLIRNKNQSSIL